MKSKTPSPSFNEAEVPSHFEVASGRGPMLGYTKLIFLARGFHLVA